MVPAILMAVEDWQPGRLPPKSVESETVTTESTNYEGRRVVISDEVAKADDRTCERRTVYRRSGRFHQHIVN